MQIRGINLNVRKQDQGMPLIWAHGLMMNMAAEDQVNWFQWAESPEQIRLIRYDARGHGDSQSTYHTTDYLWNNLGRDMLALADACDESRFIAGGASMGCATALYAALQAPERIKALLLVIPPTLWETRAAQGRFYRSMALAGGLLGGERLAALSARGLDRMLPDWLVEAEREQLAGLADGIETLKRRTLWHLMRGAAASNLPPREQLARLTKIPTAIFGWEGDRSHPVSSAEALNALLPQSSLYIAKDYAEFKSIPTRMRQFLLDMTASDGHVPV